MIMTLDCEFNGFGGELISLALFREDGKAFYAILPVHEMNLDPWVKDNVIPILRTYPKPQNESALKVVYTTKNVLPYEIQSFLSDCDGTVEIITDWPDDIRYFCESIITSPGNMISIKNLTFEMVRTDSWKILKFHDPNMVQHNALCDAIALWCNLKS